MMLAIAGKCMRQMLWTALCTLALWSVVERGWAEISETTEIRFQAPLAPLLTGCGAKSSDTLDTGNQAIHKFCRLVKSSRVQLKKTQRAEVISGTIHPQLLVQALKELLRDENYAIIITTGPRTNETSPPRDLAEVRIFSHTAGELPPPLQAIANRPEIETAEERTADEPATSAERLEQRATEAENPEDRIEALESLTELGDADAEAVLLSFRLLHNDNAVEVREAAMNVLFDLRGQDVYDVISKAAIEDPSPLLRVKALDNLVDLSDRSMRNALEAALLQALEDQDRRVSEHAEKLLTTLEP
ncbi:HEAT repeat domain-containing protein [Candidatus Entotheonella palauensis]|uniref:HEAT repeat domain-containing protein n=1 Tax=Candidatus Entotheonella gemina TaxID=1429439 RepID=W4M934_9BACT|nr:HEAT repeat domain-containing protein [Candidatus Entotheonella palauensis]ETX06431.1 MAG: hypothetical protein ETSY2_17100 [Candidatus Entotheonella gemina]